jgi:hypothetical protein
MFPGYFAKEEKEEADYRRAAVPKGCLRQGTEVKRRRRRRKKEEAFVGD